MNDLRYAVRQLLRQRALSAVVVLTLAIGIGAGTAIFSVFHGVLLRPLPYQEPDDLVMVFRTVPRFGLDRSTVSYPDFADWRSEATSVSDMVAYGARRAVIDDGGLPREVSGVRATASLWRVLGVPPQIGTTFGLAEDRPGAGRFVVLSHGLWQRALGGAPGVVGQGLELAGETHTVIGVMPPDFYFPSPATEFWEPLQANREELVRDSNFLTVLARLAPGATVARAQSELATIAGRIDRTEPDANEEYGVRVEARHAFVVRNAQLALRVLLGAVVVVLAIAWANIGNLLLVRGTHRRREIAVRAALGASRQALIRGHLVESTLLALLGGTLGVLLAVFLTDGLVGLVPDLPRSGEVRVDATVLLASVGVSVLAGLAFGMLPALQATREDPRTAMGEVGRTTGGRRGARIRGGLVVAQVGLALVLVVAAALLGRSYQRLTSISPGFDPAALVAGRVSLPETRYPEADDRRAFFATLLARLERLSTVERAGATVALPFTPASFSRTFVREDEAVAPGQEHSADYSVVAGDYFAALEIPMLRGRAFTDTDDATAPPVAVINETMARRFWPDRDPIGQRFKPGSVGEDAPWVTVIGVAGDVRTRSLASAAEPGWYRPFGQVSWASTLYVVARARADVARLPGVLRREVAGLDPSLPVEGLTTMTGLIGESVADPRMRAVVIVGFGGFAALLATLGVFSLMAFVVAQRSKEIGVRMALGAQPRRVVLGVVAGGVKLVSAGLVVGTLVAFAASRVLRSFLFGIAPTDLATYAGATLLLAVLATLGCYVPARRAARIDPMDALRHE